MLKYVVNVTCNLPGFSNADEEQRVLVVALLLDDRNLDKLPEDQKDTARLILLPINGLTPHCREAIKAHSLLNRKNFFVSRSFISTWQHLASLQVYLSNFFPPLRARTN